MKKNVASQKVGCQMVSATDGSAFTGSVTVAVTGDAGTQATGSVGSGACTHEGGGYHTYSPAQAETNYDLVAFTFSGTGAVPVTVQVYPLPTTGILAPTTAGRTLTADASGHVILQDASLVTAKLGTFALAKTTNITGFNDIAATAIVSSGAITTSGGAVSSVTTTTNLTNLPSIPANWITAAGINSDAFTAAKFASGAFDAVWSVATRAITDKAGFTISGTTTTLDALQTALSSTHGAGSWATATGFSTHSASDVWAVGTRVLTAGTNIQLPSNGLANVTAWTVAITGNVTGNLSGSVGSVTGGINTGSGTITTLDALDTAQDAQHGTTQTAVAALPTAAQNAAGLLDLASGVETGLTPRQALRLMTAALAGELSGAATTTIVIRNAVADSKDRITATVDADGNRSAITVDLT